MNDNFFYLPKNLTAPSILAVFAHPDDEAFLVGGTLAHYAKNGARVELLCLTHGEKGFTEEGHYSQEQLARIRRAELQDCCDVLGVKLLPILNFPDGGLVDLDITRLARPIAQIIYKRQPDIVITFGRDGLTGHPDHIVTSRATTLAFNQTAVPAESNRLLLYAGLSRPVVQSLSNRMEGSLGEIPLQLTGLSKARLPIKVDIRQTSRLKWAALECHRTQSHNFRDFTATDRELLSQYEYFRLARVAVGSGSVSSLAS